MAEVVIMRFNFRHDAEFAQGFLHDARIPARVVCDDAGGVAPGGFFGSAKLSVPARDLDRAMATLSAAGVMEED